MKTASALILALVILTGVGLASSSSMSSTRIASLPTSTISNSQNLELVSQIGEGGTANAVAVQGNYAFLGLGSLLAVLDISSPAAPRRVGSLWMPGDISAIAAAGNYVYVCGGGLRVINISDPVHPMEVGFESGGCSSRRVIHNSYAYVLGGGVRVLDISNPAHPIAIGYYSPSIMFGAIQDFTIAGTYVYVVTMYEGDTSNQDVSSLYIADISHPANPVEVGSYSMPGFAVYSVGIVGNYAYLGGTFLWIMNVSSPSHPVIADISAAVQDIYRIKVSGHYLYVLTRLYRCVQEIDITVPTNPVPRGGSGGNPLRRDMAVSGGKIYLASGWGGLEIMDVPSFSIVGGYTTLDWMSEVAVQGNYAYAITNNGFWIMDISNPTQPAEAGMSSGFCSQFFGGLHVVGNYAYMRVGHAGACSSEVPVRFRLKRNTAPKLEGDVPLTAEHAVGRSGTRG